MHSNPKPLLLYQLLNIDPTATQPQIKQSYRKLALKFHPDKNQGDPQAKEHFQKLVEAYNILSNEDKRKLYDQTGQIDDNIDQFKQAYDFYRDLFPKITKQDIQDFEKRYRNGPMEEEDLIAFYNSSKGNIRKILENIPLSVNEDVERFIKFYDEQIQLKKIKKYKNYSTSKNEIELLEDETSQFEEREQEMKQLEQAIVQRRCQDFDSFVKQLEDRYGKQKKKKDPKEKKESVEKPIKKEKKKEKKQVDQKEKKQVDQKVQIKKKK